MKVITSPSNAFIKDLVRLRERKGILAEKFILVEGFREQVQAVTHGFEVEQVVVCDSLVQDFSRNFLAQLKNSSKIQVSEDVFAKIAVREGSCGFISLVRMKQRTLKDIEARFHKEPPFVVVVEDVEKPGNLGALLRTADGAGVHGLVILNKRTDPWNQNIVRSSLGAIFSVPVAVVDDSTSFFDWCQQNKIKTVAAYISETSKNLFQENLATPVALILGSEAKGLSQEVARASEIQVKIPMLGSVDSLNVSVAGAVMIYETYRQRHLI